MALDQQEINRLNSFELLIIEILYYQELEKVKSTIISYDLFDNRDVSFMGITERMLMESIYSIIDTKSLDFNTIPLLLRKLCNRGIVIKSYSLNRPLYKLTRNKEIINQISETHELELGYPNKA